MDLLPSEEKQKELGWKTDLQSCYNCKHVKYLFWHERKIGEPYVQCEKHDFGTKLRAVCKDWVEQVEE